MKLSGQYFAVVMESPICLSQYFVNKQNVRSYENIGRKELLKAEDKLFLKYLFEGEAHLVSHLTEEFTSLLGTVKNNFRHKLNNDFREYFKTADDKLKLRSLDKQDILENCCKALYDILPKLFFGAKNNIEVLRSLIQSVVYSMRRQHILLIKFIGKWDYSVSMWNKISDMESKKILYHLLIWIVKHILSSMICLNFYVTTCRVDADENKLFYFCKSHWQRFYDLKISDLIATKIIRKCESTSFGNKLKKKRHVHERVKLKSQKKDIPKLHLVLKSNNNCRPIVQYRNDAQSPAGKFKLKERLKYLQLLTGKSQQKLETQFPNLHKRWVNGNKPKLYFVKTDLTNAFGEVCKEKLLQILREKHVAFQNIEKNAFLKNKMSHHYREIVKELQRPLLVRAGSTVFEWQEGLVQGYKYSPALSEIYYTYLDDLYFKEHMKTSATQIKLFTRVVDDYLYITDSLDDANLFLAALSNYRNVNYAKTVVNFDHPKIMYNKHINFLGYCYNTEEMHVSRSKNVFVGQMCFKIGFTSAISDIPKFLDNRIGQSGIQVNGLIFSFLHNPEELIWRHIFTTFCLSANKFCTILAILCNENEMLNHLQLYKKRVVVKLSNSIVDVLSRNNIVSKKFIYCINHFRHLSWKALYLCAKGTLKCSCLIPIINDELARTNCLFGKWQQHASAVKTTGELLRQAVKETCRKPVLRSLMKYFNQLPDGFECYNHRLDVNKTIKY